MRKINLAITINGKPAANATCRNLKSKGEVTMGLNYYPTYTSFEGQQTNLDTLWGPPVYCQPTFRFNPQAVLLFLKNQFHIQVNITLDRARLFQALVSVEPLPSKLLASCDSGCVAQTRLPHYLLDAAQAQQAPPKTEGLRRQPKRWSNFESSRISFGSQARHPLQALRTHPIMVGNRGYETIFCSP
jgi:hypothetical protein